MDIIVEFYPNSSNRLQFHCFNLSMSVLIGCLRLSAFGLQSIYLNSCDKFTLFL